jgi:hypothetical protein
VKRPVKAPLMVTRCQGCMRRRACAFLPVLAGFHHPLCRQCIRRVMASVVPALLALKRQEP